MDYLSCGFQPVVDHLTFVFLAIILIAAVPSAVYAAPYFRREFTPARARAAGWLLAGFIVSLGLVVCAGNAISFLVSWELMALLSWLLVVTDARHAAAVRAGVLYLVMTHAATACIIAGFCLLYPAAGSFDFQALSAAAHALPPGQRTTVFLLFLAGFGTKAGLVPLHLWLPYAHPQAPSPVSGIMSGAMVKMGVYGIVRFVFGMLGVTTPWWGGVIMAAAGVTMVTGALYALMETDIKKILAYSTIENIGIIMLGVGVAALCAASGFPQIAVLALAAALFHAVNHAAFKNLLFLAAGAVALETHTRNIEHLGGLIKRMPWTAGLFFVGAASAAALPPLNGFASEWLTLQSLLAAIAQGSAPVRVLAAAGIAALALTGGLAAAASVRLFGITFLGRPRTPAGDHAQDTPRRMRYAMAVPALFCCALGLGAGVVARYCSSAAAGVLSAGSTDAPLMLGGLILAPRGLPGPFLSTVAIACLLFIAAAGTLVLLRRRAPVRGKTWGCGYYQLGPRTQYSATAFSKPFRIAFGFFLLPAHRAQTVRETPYMVRSMRYDVTNTFIFKKYLYELLYGGLIGAARRMKWIQAGTIQLYIAYIFVTIIVLLVLVR